MCGIAGYVSRESWPGDAMVEALAHRGPDDRGTYDERVGEREVFLGHTRLSIIDLSDNGHQPMVAHNQQAVIAFNGEIYNYRDLRIDLIRDLPLRSQTDTEVLLEHLVQKGMDGLADLNGDFAFAYLDRSTKKFYLVRDRLGVKPLYYRWENGTLHFASEVKAILAGGVKATLDESHLQRFFVFKYSPGQETLFKGVHRVPPGHYLCLDLQSGELDMHCYWKPRPVAVAKTYQDRQAELRALLEDAVRLRLVADVPVSTFLSGGLDSSIIASILRNEPNIRHYCAVKDESDVRAEGTTSDAVYADRLAEAWKLNYSRIPIGKEALTPTLIRETLRYGDDLIADGSQIPAYLITRAACSESTVVLTGMGADELFFGYAGHIIVRWAQGLDRLPPFVVNPLAHAMAGVHPGRGRFKAIKRYLFKLGRYCNHPQRFAPLSVVGDWETALALCPGSEEELVGYLDRFEGDNDLERLQAFERENFLVKNLHYTDRMSMANAMESRVPFLDHRLVEMAYALPQSDRLNGLGNTKRILKDAFASDLPRDIVQRRKAGFGMPLRSLLSDPQTLKTLLDPAFFANFDGFSADAVNRLVEDHRRGTADQSALLYALISFEHWYKLYIAN